MRRSRICYATDSTADRDRLAKIIDRANDLEFWRAVRMEKRKHAPHYSGWFAETLWIDGTPAPLLAFKLRGCVPLQMPPAITHALTF